MTTHEQRARILDEADQAARICAIAVTWRDFDDAIRWATIERVLRHAWRDACDEAWGRPT